MRRGVAGVSWSWIELLEHLARAWPYLLLEERNPLGIDARPDRVQAIAEETRWPELANEARAREEHSLYEWSECHDLSCALEGARVPSVWIERHGNTVRLVVPAQAFSATLSFAETFATLTALGDAIAARVDGCDARARVAVERWERRSALDPLQHVVIATGLHAEAVRAIAGELPFGDAWETTEVTSSDLMRPNELMAAARMSGPVSDVSVVQAIVRAVRSLPRRSTQQLDSLTEDARAASREADRPDDAAQGDALARWLRAEVLGLAPEARFDVDGWMEAHDVTVGDIDLETDKIDAVACWGERHGPAVLVNPRGRHAKGVAGRRATLAHEIGHLLVDRQRALPLADVVGGAAPSHLERRARAFAAEVLVPSVVAGTRLARVGSALEAAAVVDELSSHFGASREIIAWQARNSGITLAGPVFEHLRTLVSAPTRF